MSFLGRIYYLKIIKAMYFHKAKTKFEITYTPFVVIVILLVVLFNVAYVFFLNQTYYQFSLTAFKFFVGRYANY